MVPHISCLVCVVQAHDTYPFPYQKKIIKKSLEAYTRARKCDCYVLLHGNGLNDVLQASRLFYTVTLYSLVSDRMTEGINSLHRLTINILG